jgi:hypothetical protein
VLKGCRGTARDRQAGVRNHSSARWDAPWRARSCKTLCGFEACRVVAPAKTIKIGEGFPAHPFYVKRLQGSVEPSGCLHGDVCRLTDL